MFLVRRWHGQLAGWSSLIAAVVFATGVILCFRGYLKDAEPAAAGPAEGPVLALEQALLAARGHSGSGADVAKVYLANDAEGTWCVVFDDDAGTEVYMAADGALIEVLVPPGKTFTRWMFELHTGAILGPVGPWLAALFGAIMLWLTGSGLAMRLQQLRRARRRRSGGDAGG